MGTSSTEGFSPSKKCDEARGFPWEYLVNIMGLLLTLMDTLVILQMLTKLAF